MHGPRVMQPRPQRGRPDRAEPPVHRRWRRARRSAPVRAGPQGNRRMRKQTIGYGVEPVRSRRSASGEHSRAATREPSSSTTSPARRRGSPRRSRPQPGHVVRQKLGGYTKGRPDRGHSTRGRGHRAAGHLGQRLGGGGQPSAMPPPVRGRHPAPDQPPASSIAARRARVARSCPSDGRGVTATAVQPRPSHSVSSAAFRVIGSRTRAPGPSRGRWIERCRRKRPRARKRGPRRGTASALASSGPAVEVQSTGSSCRARTRRPSFIVRPCGTSRNFRTRPPEVRGAVSGAGQLCPELRRSARLERVRRCLSTTPRVTDGVSSRLAMTRARRWHQVDGLGHEGNLRSKAEARARSGPARRRDSVSRAPGQRMRRPIGAGNRDQEQAAPIERLGELAGRVGRQRANGRRGGDRAISGTVPGSR